jgi:broad specificity phosphatase PhoE
VNGYLSGHDACQGLSDLGRTQVAALRDRLVATGELAETHRVYTSLLRRAVETTEIISPALDGLVPERSAPGARSTPVRPRA